MSEAAEDRLIRARNFLERDAVATPDLVGPMIAESWVRCLEAGLDPHRPPKLDATDAFGLRAERDQAELTRRLALAEMEALWVEAKRMLVQQR